MIAYGGFGPTTTDALLALATAAKKDRRVIVLDSLEHDVAREVGGTALLLRVQADTHPMESEVGPFRRMGVDL